MGLRGFRETLRDFAREREWEVFHTPKNLAMALAAESGELVELFQWLSDAESTPERVNPKLRTSTAEELADILIYAIRLADVLDIDLEIAISRKIESNTRRYPVEASRGRAEKMP